MDDEQSAPWPEDYPRQLTPIQGGWAARGAGWAVHGRTQEEAMHLYREALERHARIKARAAEAAEERSKEADDDR